MLEQFKAQQASGAGPWVQKDVRMLNIKPQVAAIQVPDPALRIPALSESGIVLTEAEGDLHDVKEMDHMYIVMVLNQGSYSII
jgi:hypothetical protein